MSALWQWLAEYDPATGEAFGLVRGFAEEWDDLETGPVCRFAPSLIMNGGRALFTRGETPPVGTAALPTSGVSPQKACFSPQPMRFLRVLRQEVPTDANFPHAS